MVVIVVVVSVDDVVVGSDAEGTDVVVVLVVLAPARHSQVAEQPALQVGVATPSQASLPSTRALPHTATAHAVFLLRRQHVLQVRAATRQARRPAWDLARIPCRQVRRADRLGCSPHVAWARAVSPAKALWHACAWTLQEPAAHDAVAAIPIPGSRRARGTHNAAPDSMSDRIPVGSPIAQ